MYAIVDFQQHRRFEELRERLTAAEGRRLDRPLAYWALVSDRRLPRAFMGRATRDIVETPFGQLCGEPGIGRKKMGTLLELLERALAHAHCDDQGIHSDPSCSNGGPQSAVKRPLSTADVDAGFAHRFDPRAVSEPLWERWRETVKLHGLELEPLARFAPSLQDLPRVIWHTPLAEYTGLTLVQLRGRKKHGEKRVRAVVEVFAAVQSLLGDRPAGHLAVRIVPRTVTVVETWLHETCLHGAGQPAAFPSPAEVRRSFVEPLLAQLRCDGGELIARLVAGRSNLTDEFPTVRAAAQALGLTRARVYQLLAEATTILSLRWPDARLALQPLAAKAGPQCSTGRGAKLFLDAVELLFAV